jgi:hypothetical protein
MRFNKSVIMEADATTIESEIGKGALDVLADSVKKWLATRPRATKRLKSMTRR